MKVRRGSRGTAPLILNLDTRGISVVNFTPRPIYSRGKSLSTHRIWSWVGSRDNPVSYSRCCTLKQWTHSNLYAAPFNVHISNIIFIYWQTWDYSTYWEWQKGWRIVSYNWELPDGVPVRHEACRSLGIKKLLWFYLNVCICWSRCNHWIITHGIENVYI